ncbi:DUF6221 family protein [Plantactinospora solaniradicis]|uniref:DUF6221 family protein n=1 Tax=Plantactinospora solaniradicis TaxID=1723736 RepID=A0ABW1K9J9_9ACTN
MSDLIPWICAQLDEDERVALAVRDQRWVYRRSYDNAADQTDHVLIIGDRAVGADFGDDPLRPTEAEHAALHDPARVLAEVAAKRRIIDRHQPIEIIDALYCTHCGVLGGQRARDVNWPCPEILDAAAPYADREGYREEWRPDA